MCVFTFAAACARTYFMPTKFTCAALSFPPLVIITFIYYYYLCSLSRIYSRRGSSSSSICAVVARPVSLSYILHAFFLSLRFVAPSCLLARSPSSAALRNYERGHRMATVAVVGADCDCDWDWARGAEEHASASATSLRFALTLKLFGFSLLFCWFFFYFLLSIFTQR